VCAQHGRGLGVKVLLRADHSEQREVQPREGDERGRKYGTNP